MKAFRIPAGLMAMLMMSFAFTGCGKDIVVVAHSECVDLRVGDEKVGALTVNEKASVTIREYGATRVKWLNEEEVEVTDTIWGEDAEDNDIWHLYLDYGSFNKPKPGGSEEDNNEVDGESGGEGEGEGEDEGEPDDEEVESDESDSSQDEEDSDNPDEDGDEGNTE